MLHSSHSTALRLLQQQGYSLWTLHLEARRLLQEDVVTAYIAGQTQAEIARTFGLSEQMVSQWIPAQLKRPKPSIHQERDRDIIARAKKGENYLSIASAYGLTKQRIGQIALAGGVRQRFYGRPFGATKLAQALAAAAKLPNEKERLK